MLDQQTDWSAFQRLDNAAVVDFLTSAAGALADQGLIGPKDTDNLRLVLSGINSGAMTRDQPLMLALERQHADFLALLSARYGTSGLCANILRHTLRGPISDTRRSLADWGQALLKKMELLFNRPLHLAGVRPRDRQALLSTIIVDFSETLATVCQTLEDALNDLARMNPHAMAGASEKDDETDLLIARACGFESVLRQGLPGAGERAIKRRIANAVGLVAEEALALATQLGANSGEVGAGYGMVAICEQLVAESQRLALLDLPTSESLLHWEVRRRSLVAAVLGIGESLRQLSRQGLERLGPDALENGSLPPGVYLESARRRVTFSLISGGLAGNKALDATADLFRYLEEHKLATRDVLPGELAKINPSLTVGALDALTTATTDQTSISRALPEKAATLSRAKGLAASFAAALALGATLGGCGLKTSLKSEVPELRPDIVFQLSAPPQGASPTSPSPTETTTPPSSITAPVPQFEPGTPVPKEMP